MASRPDKEVFQSHMRAEPERALARTVSTTLARTSHVALSHKKDVKELKGFEALMLQFHEQEQEILRLKTELSNKEATCSRVCLAFSTPLIQIITLYTRR